MNVTEQGIVASKGVLPNLGGDVTRETILEYARAVSGRYLTASKREKGVILDEFCKNTGHHRKSAVRLLRHPPQTIRTTMGRPRKYALPVVEALRVVWETSDRMCGKRLAPFIGELLAALERHGELNLDLEVRQQLLTMSAATIDRRLKPYRSVGMRRPYTHRRSPTALKAQIPVRTFGEWAEVTPGSMQLDLVAHCGESTEGFYLNTLVGVDVASSWSEYAVIWGKGQERVGTAVHKVRQRVPFPLREVHTDNGSEFINAILYPWCKKEGIRFTRGRPYKKNDQAYVEQKNWSVPRRLIGYDRYSTKAAYEQMQRLYENVRLYVNFFQPVSKLVSKERVGAKVKKRYDRAQTPYQRLLASGTLDETRRKSLAKLYLELNPVKLRGEIEDTLEVLWKLADRGKTPGSVSAMPRERVVCG